MDSRRDFPISKVAFIGGGNMARCLIGGAITAGLAPDRISVGEPGDGPRAQLRKEFAVHATADNLEAVAGADTILLAVKPQAAAKAAASLVGHLSTDAVVVSIMAGIRVADLRRWLGKGPAIVRTMPNTPALVGLGMTVLYAGDDVPKAARARAQALLDGVGATLWVDDEDALDAVTALSGSGPAYLFLVAEAMRDAGVQAGLTPGAALTLVTQTLRGAAEMAVVGGVEPAELRRQVTSPGGTTEAAVAELERGGVRQAFASAIQAATARGRSLADEFGRDG